jgi:hypothetical protein
VPVDIHKNWFILPHSTDWQYHALMVSLRNALGLEQSDVAKFRLKVLNHLYLYGCQAAFEKSGKKLSSLIPQSTSPHHTRTMTVNLKLQALI